MVSYDSEVLFRFADKLYRRATGVILQYMIVGGLIGGGAILLINTEPVAYAAIAAVFGAGFGYLVGTERAFSLKL